MPRRRLAAESHAITIDPRWVRRYRRLISGEGHADLEALPPLYPAIWETALALELFASDDLPLPTRGIVHVESEIVCVRPLRVTDQIRCRVELDAAERHSRGLRTTLKSRHWNGTGQLCQENSLTVLIPSGPSTGSAAEPIEAGGVEQADPADWSAVAEWDLRANLGRRYARVSGDINPIHLWRWSSRLLGFDRPILQGYCTAAMVADALTRAFWGARGDALRRIRVRFARPLFLPARARLVTAPGASDGAGRFRVLDAEEPQARPFAEGEFVGG